MGQSDVSFDTWCSLQTNFDTSDAINPKEMLVIHMSHVSRLTFDTSLLLVRV